MTPRPEQCAVHTEFSKRLDDRWGEHLEKHEQDRLDVCKKIDLLFDMHHRIEARINWMLGGIACGVFVVQVLINFMKTH